jgi:hypothetical protein
MSRILNHLATHVPVKLYKAFSGHGWRARFLDIFLKWDHLKIITINLKLEAK